MNCMESFQRAYTRMKECLFHPFSLGVWFTLALPAWLANLGGGYGFNGLSLLNNFGNLAKLASAGHEGGQGAAVPGIPGLEGIGIGVMVALIIAAAVVLAVLVLVLTWVVFRARFVFFSGVADARYTKLPFGERWRMFEKPGKSMYFFVLGTFLICAVVFFAAEAILVGSAILLTHGSAWRFAAIFSAAAVPVILLIPVFAVLTAFYDFGTMLMIRNPDMRAMEAFKRFLTDLKRKPGAVVLYLLGLAAMQIVFQTGVVLIQILTCCLCAVGFIAASIPYLWAVAFLPLLYLRAGFAVEYCAEFSGDYSILPVAEEEEDAFPADGGTPPPAE